MVSLPILLLLPTLLTHAFLKKKFGGPCGMWDLSFLTRHQTCIPCIARQILNHWTTREVQSTHTFMNDFKPTY